MTSEPESQTAETDPADQKVKAEIKLVTSEPAESPKMTDAESSDLAAENGSKSAIKAAPADNKSKPSADDVPTHSESTQSEKDIPTESGSAQSEETVPVKAPDWVDGAVIQIPDPETERKKRTEESVVPLSMLDKMSAVDLTQSESINITAVKEADEPCLPAPKEESTEAAPAGPVRTELLFLKVNSSDRRDAAKFLKENALMLQVVMGSLLLLAFGMVGWQAAVMLLVSAGVVLSLIGLSFLTFHGIKIDPDALVFTRGDWCGKVSYALTFEDIEKAEDIEGTLVLHLRNRRVSWLNKLLFKDIVEKPFYKDPARFKFRLDDFELPEHGNTLLTALENQGKLVRTQPITLKVNSALQRSASNYLTNNSPVVRVILTIAFFLCMLIMPPVLSFTALVLVIVIFLLNLFSGQIVYNITSTDEALRLTRFDWAGETNLVVPWSNIDKVNDTASGSILIHLKELRTNFAQKLVFEEITDSKGKILKLNLNDIEAPEERQRLLDRITASTKFIPKDLPKTAVDANLPLETTKVREWSVKYNPHRVAQEKIQGFLKKSEKLWLLLLAVAAVGLMYGAGMTIVLAALILGCCAGIILVRQNKENPTGLLFDNDGLAFGWSSRKSRTIPWSSINHVSAFSPTGRKLFDSIIDIHLEQNTAKEPWLVALKGLMPFHFATVKGTTIRLRMGGLDGPQARKDLLQALRTNLPAEKIGNDVNSLLNPTDPDSYTTLWLASLGAAPQRTFEGTLPTGYQLDNGKYEITELLGAGGQATAYLAKERGANGSTSEGKTVVLKEFILPSHAGAELSSRSIEHIKREYELIRRIHNDKIVEYHGLFIEDHRAYLVLEHIAGPSLRQLVEKEGALPQERVIELAKQMADILTHLHDLSPPVVHRDFTPENLILDPSGKLKLIDFNVAQELETNATRTIVGKHSYIPPEQFRGKPCAQSDIYACGATLHYLLTAQEPEPITTSHPAKLNEEVSQDLDAIVAHATEKDLAKRFQNAQELKSALDKLAGE